MNTSGHNLTGARFELKYERNKKNNQDNFFNNTVRSEIKKYLRISPDDEGLERIFCKYRLWIRLKGKSVLQKLFVDDTQGA